ncbi:MAG: hypothetical protein D6677_04790 [Calditrichaeota bacterium]|nr:MAG: hypothetical protein D6677_04790 [Calditrichota bacterium]
MRLLFTLLCSVLLPLSFVYADETGGKAGFGLKGGFERYSGDVDGAALNGYIEGHAQWWISNALGVSLTFGRGVLSAEDGSEYFTTNVWNYMGLIKYKPWNDWALNPYLAFGFERFDIDPKAQNGHRVPAFAAGVNRGDYAKLNSAIPFGVGVTYF